MIDLILEWYLKLQVLVLETFQKKQDPQVNWRITMQGLYGKLWSNTFAQTLPL